MLSHQGFARDEAVVYVPTASECAIVYKLDQMDCWRWIERQGIPTGREMPAAVADLLVQAYAEHRAGWPENQARARALIEQARAQLPAPPSSGRA